MPIWTFFPMEEASTFLSQFKINSFARLPVSFQVRADYRGSFPRCNRVAVVRQVAVVYATTAAKLPSHRRFRRRG
jgi:hypothetical protein